MTFNGAVVMHLAPLTYFELLSFPSFTNFSLFLLKKFSFGMRWNDTPSSQVDRLFYNAYRAMVPVSHFSGVRDDTLHNFFYKWLTRMPSFACQNKWRQSKLAKVWQRQIPFQTSYPGSSRYLTSVKWAWVRGCFLFSHLCFVCSWILTSGVYKKSMLVLGRWRTNDEDDS